mmetsp:Transcript_5758/g.12157  ORF Transcript_5758/g.12157 Transcript_5758/m.12157 type:complete len:801 (+) Transcript_5758:198-2600(+)
MLYAHEQLLPPSMRCHRTKRKRPCLLLSPPLLKVLVAAAAIAAAVSLDDAEFATTNRTEPPAIGPDTDPDTDPDIDPDLPFGDINIMVVSDVHSFVGGHPHEPDRNADYGDLYSFHERLKAHVASKSWEDTGDLWFFNNGDWLHGTGLAMDGNSTNLLPIVNAMPWDILTMGRQESTYTDVLRDMNETLLPVFPRKYVTSNVVWNETKDPYGERYRLLKGRNSTILLFGFLYDVKSPSETINVIPVEETIQQDWFRDLLKPDEETGNYDYDAVVVMAQIDNFSPLVHQIYLEIRSNVDGRMPIQFITGHSHKRELTYGKHKDAYIHQIEPGGLFDTIGWVTIPKFENARGYHPRSPELRESFTQEFVNTSKTVLASRLGLNETTTTMLRTEKGEALSKMIQNTQEKLGLHQAVACPGHDYFRNISIYDENSLWKLWREHVVRTQVFKKDEDRVMLVSKRTFRYDLRGSGKYDAMTMDDVIAIAPYMEKVVYVGEVPDWMVRRMNNTFNTFSHHNIIPDYVLAGDIDVIKTADSYHLYTHEVDIPKIKTKLEKFNFQNFVLKYTGQRDTLYWLDYLRKAYPCKGKENEELVMPYFYDPNELEEETTDGKLTEEDTASSGNDDDESDGAAEGDEDEEEVWTTLPPDEEYAGYVPGKGDTQKIPQSVYVEYKSKTEKEKEEAARQAKILAKRKKKDLKSQLQQRKKTQKKIVKGFALFFAGCVLMVPVVCLVLQVTGHNDEYDNDRYGDGGMNGMYDQEEVQLLKRHRRRGGGGTTRGGGGRGRRRGTGGSIYDRPVREIELF